MEITNKMYDEERALYGSRSLTLTKVSFDGPQDGESALKESKNITINDCYFNLRYPLWHDDNITILNSNFTENARASIWYTSNIFINESKLHGIKAVRESNNIIIKNCSIISSEFGWFNNVISLTNCDIISEYFLLHSTNITLQGVTFKGKYSFQYVKNVEINDSNLDTKDAFWHSKNVMVKNSIIKGEYLGWYSENLTIIDSKIIGTQPFCYAKNLTLINCEMIDCDLAFEKTSVQATIINTVKSIKNPLSGKINAYGIEEIIIDDPNFKCEINTKIKK